MKITLRLLKTKEEILSSYLIMKELRPCIEEANYVDLIRELEIKSNYQLLGVEVDNKIEAVSGFRISQSIAWGKYLYIDDLITTSNSRSGGHGKEMLDWLSEYAKKNLCKRIDLDSGVQRFGAHRFYLRERMDIICYHFMKTL
ncbi:GNAT family N-acetyltransferase [Flavivirga jejuensis]|uniref:GNAT family N-acetyltransferase n=1 Tax=Flavivirga jejuensis TaxID=870487 RepID=A0ABT8WT70_9FLAO|nr:GNAT family N-acetyltransferase [Flavivirga jejuensis]MDO5976356.1 GNAT family N-acetyltransferase [Flavivirga jejuensis]